MTITETVTDLRAEVTELRTMLTALTDQLATEVRTRRLVVVGPDGYERIIADAWDTGASVIVHGRGETIDPPAVTIHVGEGSDGDATGPMATIMVTPRDGHTTGEVVLDGSGPVPAPGLHEIVVGPDGYWYPRTTGK